MKNTERNIENIKVGREGDRGMRDMGKHDKNILCERL